MAHFAKVNKQTNLVVDIVVVGNKDLLDENGIEVEQKGIDFLNKTFPNEIENKWIQCSIWTVNNQRIEQAPPVSSTGSSNGFRGNFPVVNKGYWYPEKQKFINPSYYPSWVLDENDVWQPPIKGPTEEQCYYGTGPFVPSREAHQYPVNAPLITYVTIINPEGKEVEVPKGRIVAQWDETNQIWKGMHNDAQWRYWNGTAWNQPL
jgi:hypothetical protein